MRNELLRWAEKSKKRCSDLTNPLVMGYNYALTHLIDKIKSIPVPSVEGYLEGKVDNNVLHLKNGGITNYLTITEALTALRELKEDCEGEYQKKLETWASSIKIPFDVKEMQHAYDQCRKTNTEMLINCTKWMKKVKELQAEVERLRGDGWIGVEDRLPIKEDEMIVTIEVMRMNESGMKYIHISDVGKIKPGKYKLTKIG